MLLWKDFLMVILSWRCILNHQLEYKKPRHPLWYPSQVLNLRNQMQWMLSLVSWERSYPPKVRWLIRFLFFFLLLWRSSFSVGFFFIFDFVSVVCWFLFRFYYFYYSPSFYYGFIASVIVYFMFMPFVLFHTFSYFLCKMLLSNAIWKLKVQYCIIFVLIFFSFCMVGSSWSYAFEVYVSAISFCLDSLPLCWYY